ncbi:MAG: proline dehydrogenase family protein [Bacteroidota bacterium]
MATNELSFENIENAFAYKSNSEITKAYWLFKSISLPVVVKLGPALTEVALKLHLPIKWAIKGTIYSHFCGGETIEDCKETIANLARFNVGSILDYSVEGKEEEREFDLACEEIIRTVNRAGGDPDIPFCVFKVTGLARFALLEKMSEGLPLSAEEKTEAQKVYNRIDSICSLAYKLRVKVFIDAEESWIQNAIDDLALNMMKKYNKEKAIIYNTIQLYRHDRLDYLRKSHQHAIEHNYFLGLKLVRGAYMEKERKRAAEKEYKSPIQPDKSACDIDYNEALKYSVMHIDRISICAGTHNAESCMLLTELMKANHIANDDERIYFSQLLGMSDHISFNLAKAGYKVAKYVPYGPVISVLPYLTRRAQENSSMSGQMGRELKLILAEKKRRKALQK